MGPVGFRGVFFVENRSLFQMLFQVASKTERLKFLENLELASRFLEVGLVKKKSMEPGVG